MYHFSTNIALLHFSALLDTSASTRFPTSDILGGPRTRIQAAWVIGVEVFAVLFRSASRAFAVLTSESLQMAGHPPPRRLLDRVNHA